MNEEKPVLCAYAPCGLPVSEHPEGPNGLCEEHSKDVAFLAFALRFIHVQGAPILSVIQSVVEASMMAQAQELRRRAANGSGIRLLGHEG